MLLRTHVRTMCGPILEHTKKTHSNYLFAWHVVVHTNFTYKYIYVKFDAGWLGGSAKTHCWIPQTITKKRCLCVCVLCGDQRKTVCFLLAALFTGHTQFNLYLKKKLCCWCVLVGSGGIMGDEFLGVCVCMCMIRICVELSLKHSTQSQNNYRA